MVRTDCKPYKIVKLKEVIENGNPKEQAYKFFVEEKGYTPEMAKGIIGNLIQESGDTLSPTRQGKDGSIGIAQWKDSRRTNLMKVRPDDYNTLRGQLEFIDWELKNTEKKAYDKLMQSQTVEDATLNFSNYYERPNKDYANNENRVKYASELPFKTKSSSVNIANLDRNLIDYISTLEPEYQEMLLATSGNDSKHGDKSRHYDNRAVDFRFNPKLYERVKNDPMRLQYGITLLDPNHGTAPHLHMSVGNASENKKDVWMDPHSEEAKSLISGMGQQQNSATTSPTVPSIATAPISPNYATLPSLEEDNAKKEEPKAVTEAQLRKILEAERAQIEKRFMEAFAQQNQPQQEEQPMEQYAPNMDELYQYIDIETFQDGGKIPVSRDGMYKYPNRKVLVPTDGSITMKNINHPVLGISKETGERKMMTPNGEYFFYGTKNVLEVPIMQDGGKQEGPLTVNYGTPEYEKAYREGLFLDYANELPEVTITAKPQPMGKLDKSKIGNARMLKDEVYDSIIPQESTKSASKGYDKTSFKQEFNSERSVEEYNAVINEIKDQRVVSEAVEGRDYNFYGKDYGANVEKVQKEDPVIETYFKNYSNSNIDDVTQIQESLISKGYTPGVIDGKFGKNTKAAYEDMQEDMQVSKTTIDKYYKKGGEENKQKVINIQKELVKKGLLTEDQVDGDFGDKTRDAVLSANLNTYDPQNKFSSENIKKIKKLDTEWCAKGMSNILEAEGVDASAIGIKGVDAWHMSERMSKQKGFSQVYNIYDEFKDQFKGVETGEDLVRVTDEVKAKSKTTPEMYRKGDIVGLYWRGSVHQGDEPVLKSNTKNTHVGFVSDVVDGVPIITHNVGGTVHHDPYNKLQTAWINRNESMHGVPKRRELPNKEYETTSFINNFENQIGKPLNNSQKEIATKIYQRASNNAENLPKEIGSSVDPSWLKDATIGVIRLESKLGLKADFSREELAWDRKIAHDVKGTKEDEISYGVGKAKLSHLDSFAKGYFGVKSVDDFKDVNKGTDLVSYRLAKNYDTFKDYSEKFPELGLNEEDLRNMAILAYNQGTDKLIMTGRVKDNRSPKEEVEALRSLYKGKVKDISSTNWRYLEKMGLTGLANKAYDMEYPEGHESYISRVNRFSEELSGRDSQKLAIK